MGFLNYNKIFNIDILNLETGCNKKIRDDFDHMVQFMISLKWRTVRSGCWIIYLIDAVKGKEISILLQI